MAVKQRKTVGELWSSTYHNPTFDDSRAKDNNATLVDDIRRLTRRTLVFIGVFAIVLRVGAGSDPAINLLIVAGGPVAIVAVAGELLALWLRLRQRM